MARPRLLDLCCGQGIASMGYHLSGFDVTGLDLHPQPRYPFRFWQLDVMELPAWVFGAFDAIAAHPPCQRYSAATRVNGNPAEHPDLIGPLRERLQRSGKPWAMENVPGSPLADPVLICGAALGLGIDGHILRRHRYVEASFDLTTPGCGCYRGDGPTIGAYGGGNSTAVRRSATSGGRPRKVSAVEARQIFRAPWATRAGIVQAVPVAYAEIIGAGLRAQLG